MSSEFVLAVLVLCAVIVNVLCAENDKSNTPGHLRVKRAKYFSNPPTRFYRKPPITYPVKGYYSYTPPPNFMMDNDGPPYPGNFRPKVSKRPTITSDGLGDDDINSLLKHLSKQDLDKLIEFAGEKHKDSSLEKYSTQYNKLQNREIDNVYKPTVRDLSAEQKFSLNGPFVSNAKEQQVETTMSSYQPEIIKSRNVFTKTEDLGPFKGPYAPDFNSAKGNFAYDPSQILTDFSSLGLDTQESMQHRYFSDAQQEIYNTPSNNAQYSFTDSKTVGEEQLPKPVNLREGQDYEVAYTNDVPTIVKANSYDVKSFGDLPLMNYNSKLDTVSSYHVPHYTVISPSQQSSATSYSSSSQLVPSPAAASIRAPQLELAPPSSAAKEQSDAHLKAVKIWTHKSNGAAYTLHNDGTLSVEKPLRPKPSYGVS